MWVQLRKTLEESGTRITRPRARLLEALARHQDPFTAEEAEGWAPTVGRATVYRTLKLLVELGVLCKVFLEDGTPRYFLGSQVHHHHLVCVLCGAARDFDRCVVDEAVQRLQSGTGYQVVGHRMEVFGVCRPCQGVSRVASRAESVPAGR